MDERSFVSAEIAAARLGVPANWLKREAAAGRVPSIRAGRHLLLSPGAVEAELRRRAIVASASKQEGGSDE